MPQILDYGTLAWVQKRRARWTGIFCALAVISGIFAILKADQHHEQGPLVDEQVSVVVLVIFAFAFEAIGAVRLHASRAHALTLPRRERLARISCFACLVVAPAASLVAIYHLLTAIGMPFRR